MDNNLTKQIALVKDCTIYETIHGSHAYGMAIPTSDVDVKGVCLIPDLRLYFGSQVFNQQDRGWEQDKVVYHLPKFMKLAGECNPNIIEILYVAEEHILKMTDLGKKLRDHRDLFLSRRARWTFSGYAIAQLKRIKAHKRWIDNPPEKPDIKNYTHFKEIDVGPLGTQLSENSKVTKIIPAEESGWFKLHLETFDRSLYDSDKKDYDNYRQWKTNRNEARSKLEAEHKLDTKHAAHLVRLLRLGYEIMTEGEVRVKRPDAAELLAIRNGAWSYEKILAYAEEMEAKLEASYATCSLPHTPNWKAIENLQMEMIKEALSRAPRGLDASQDQFEYQSSPQ